MSVCIENDAEGIEASKDFMLSSTGLTMLWYWLVYNLINCSLSFSKSLLSLLNISLPPLKKALSQPRERADLPLLPVVYFRNSVPNIIARFSIFCAEFQLFFSLYGIPAPSASPAPGRRVPPYIPSRETTPRTK